MEPQLKYDSLRKILLPVGITLGIIVLIGLALYLFAIPFNIYIILKIYSHVVSKIVDISGLNQWLVKGVVIIVLMPLLWVIPNVYRGKYKNIARAIALIYMGGFFLTLYFVSKDIYFAHSGKESLKWYALTPEGVRYYDSPGVDTVYGIPLKPVTPEVIKNLKLWENKNISLVDPHKATFFNPITGEPQAWYYLYPDGAFEFYDKPGYHPITGDPLKPVTKQIYFEWKEKARYKEESLVPKKEDKKEKEAKLPPASKKPEMDEKEKRIRDFRSLINQNVVTYSDKSNIAVVIESLHTEGGLSPENALLGLLKKDKVNIIEHYFREAFKTKGYFNEIYGGNTELLTQTNALSKLDCMIVGKIDYTFKKGSQVDKDLVSCNINFTFKVINNKGDIVKSDSIKVVGPGFSEDAALERGLEILVERYSDRILKSLS
jgi:hypothetical protein